jgi:hypothetical protein
LATTGGSGSAVFVGITLVGAGVTIVAMTRRRPTTD